MTAEPKAAEYDSVLVVAFGGPEGADDVLPFLENVTRGRRVSAERLEKVAEQYQRFGGVSPHNQQVRELLDCLDRELRRRELELPVYWGNRNWHPLLPDTLGRMAQDGRHRSLALVLAAYSSYSSCRQYQQNIDEARRDVGDRSPVVDKVRAFFNHPDFIAASVARLNEALEGLERSELAVAFTAHSIPGAMANGCAYEAQLRETCRLIGDGAGLPPDRWDLSFQSRSGRPDDPWLEPDIVDHLASLCERGIRQVVVMPVGFLSDHMEVMYDLDIVAREASERLGMGFVRANTVGTHPRFVAMLGELVEERVRPLPDRRVMGDLPACLDRCLDNCCPAER